MNTLVNDYLYSFNINNKWISNIENYCYNKFLNIGMKYTQGNDWLLIINNDLIFEYGWIDRIMEASDARPDIDSFSPFEPDFHNMYYIFREQSFVYI